MLGGSLVREFTGSPVEGSPVWEFTGSPVREFTGSPVRGFS